MSQDLYFSEREEGIAEPDRPEVSVEFWAGFVGLIEELLSNGSLAGAFPEHDCSDFRSAITGCDRRAVGGRFRGENPSIPWPLDRDNAPAPLPVLDAVEFFHRFVSEPRCPQDHDYFWHRHFMRFDAASGQQKYREDINRLFRRNQHPYQLQADGQVHRMGPPVLREVLSTSMFRTGDADLDGMLNSAREKFSSPNPATRKESLEKLWDAWERLKTLENPDKLRGIDALLGKAIPASEFRARINLEAKALTEIGNDFRIRHSERNKHPIDPDEQVDYLFHRLFSLVWLLLKSTNRIR